MIIYYFINIYIINVFGCGDELNSCFGWKTFDEEFAATADDMDVRFLILNINDYIWTDYYINLDNNGCDDHQRNAIDWYTHVRCPPNIIAVGIRMNNGHDGWLCDAIYINNIVINTFYDSDNNPLDGIWLDYGSNPRENSESYYAIDMTGKILSNDESFIPGIINELPTINPTLRPSILPTLTPTNIPTISTLIPTDIPTMLPLSLINTATNTSIITSTHIPTSNDVTNISLSNETIIEAIDTSSDALLKLTFFVTILSVGLCCMCLMWGLYIYTTKCINKNQQKIDEKNIETNQNRDDTITQSSNIDIPIQNLEYNQANSNSIFIVNMDLPAKVSSVKQVTLDGISEYIDNDEGSIQDGYMDGDTITPDKNKRNNGEVSIDSESYIDPQLI